MDDGDQNCRATSPQEGVAAVKQLAPKRVWFCTNVGGGIFGEGHTAAWRSLGLDARMHFAVGVEDYWRAKSGWWSRFSLRWAMLFSYPATLWRKVRRAGPEEIFVAVTNPFFLPALAARGARRNRARVVHLVFDLYPDAFIFGGGWSPRHPLAWLAMRTTRAAISECAATVYLGTRLRQHAETHYGVARRTAVIAVGTDTAVFDGCEPQPREGRTLRCLYSGHFGRLHDWETLASALGEGLPQGIEVEIAADGPAAVALKQRLAPLAAAPAARLLFAGTRGPTAWREAMLSADVALVTMRPGAEKVVMPSKTYSAMAAGQAILAVCPRESDLADLVLAHGCGWVIAPGDVAGLRAQLESLADSGEEILQKRRLAWQAAHSLYSMEEVGKQWRELLHSLDED